MDDFERMDITLPARLVEAIRAKVRAGDYATPSDAVGAAVRLWQEHDEGQEAEADTAAMRAGIAAADADPRPSLADEELDHRYAARAARR